MVTNKEFELRRDKSVAKAIAYSSTFIADKAENTEIWDVEGKRYIDFCGGMTQTLKKTASYLKQSGINLKVIVECRNAEEIQQTLPFSFVSRILLDNHSIPELKSALKQINHKKPTEASGNINHENLVAIAETGVNYISMGALTYDAKSIDLSLNAL